MFEHHRSLSPEWQLQAAAVDARSTTQSAAAAATYNQSARTLPPLRIGSRVDMQDSRSKLWSSSSVFVAIGRNWDYLVKVANGRTYWSNRRFLRPMTAAVVNPAPMPLSKPSPPPTSKRQPTKPLPQPLRRSQRRRRVPQRLNISDISQTSYD